ncbi:MAG: hypothetical protein J4G01_05700 [Dehalococcoidia bacterium]|nr:hypothetical protein [Dehalococcoidia bacterium]
MPTGRELIAQAQEMMPKTSAQDVYQAVEQKQNLLIIDVREKEEWDQGHIGGAVHVSRGRMEGRIDELVPDKSTPIVCH